MNLAQFIASGRTAPGVHMLAWSELSGARFEPAANACGVIRFRGFIAADSVPAHAYRQDTLIAHLMTARTCSVQEASDVLGISPWSARTVLRGMVRSGRLVVVVGEGETRYGLAVGMRK